MAKSQEDAVKELMAMSEADRDKYCIGVINAISDAFEEIMVMNSRIKQAKAVRALMEDLRSKKDEILPVIFYIIKPQFRETIVSLMERFAGYAEKEMLK
jgi:hypothetical protein